MKIDDFDIQAFYDEMSKESDRASAILGAAFLDYSLTELLTNSFVDDSVSIEKLLGVTSGNAPLGAFSARIELAYCLGLIPANIRHDLDIIRKVRNRFAHKLHGLSFGVEPIRGFCASLQIGTMMRDLFPDGPFNNPRVKFLASVGLIRGQLIEATDKALENRPQSPIEFDIVIDSNSTPQPQ